MRDTRDKTDRRSPTPPEKLPQGTQHDGEGPPDTHEDARPQGTDPDYGPPDPDDPQRSGT